MDVRRPRAIVWEVVHGVARHDDFSMAAAIAFYALFSIAPLALLIVLVAGGFLGQAAARGEIAEALTGFLGPEQARQVESIISAAKTNAKGVGPSALGLISLVFGALGLFTQLTRSLNVVWEVKSRSARQGVWQFVRHRLVAAAMIGAIALLMLVSALSSAAVAAMGEWVQGRLPAWAANLRLINTGFSVGGMTLIFGLMFKALPAMRVPWRSLWVGSLVTALLFWGGRYLVGLYLGVTGVAGPYGAAGSLVVLLMWVYYCALALLLGAEFTRAFALSYEWERVQERKAIDQAMEPAGDH